MAPTPPPNQRAERPLDIVWFLLKWVVFLLVLRTLIVSPFTIPSESMLPRLLVGDYLFVTKWNYGWSRWSFELPLPRILDARAATDPASRPAEPDARRLLAHLPERGDVVVFRAPPANNQDYIKRVIGLPGDRVRGRAGTVYVNGRALTRQRIADLVVPEGRQHPLPRRTAARGRARRPRACAAIHAIAKRRRTAGRGR